MTPAKPRYISEPVPITREDLASLRGPAFVPQITKLRNSHHRLARLMASGLRDFEICARTGYNANRLTQLRSSPAFVDLVERYRAKVDENWAKNQDEYYSVGVTNMLEAERMIADRLEAADDEGAKPIPLRDLLAISRDAADRFGYGKRNPTASNTDFAAQLEKTIERSGKQAEVSALTEDNVTPIRRRLA